MNPHVYRLFRHWCQYHCLSGCPPQNSVQWQTLCEVKCTYNDTVSKRKFFGQASRDPLGPACSSLALPVVSRDCLGCVCSSLAIPVLSIDCLGPARSSLALPVVSTDCLGCVCSSLAIPACSSFTVPVVSPDCLGGACSSLVLPVVSPNCLGEHRLPCSCLLLWSVLCYHRRVLGWRLLFFVSEKP